MLTAGFAFALVACLVGPRVAQRWYPMLLGLGGILLLAAAAAATAPGTHGLWSRLWVLAAVGALPVAALAYPDDKLPRVVGAAAVAATVAGAVVAGIRPDPHIVGTVGLTTSVAVLVGLWAGLETSDEGARLALLWLALGLGLTILVDGHLLFLAPNTGGAVAALAVGLSIPASVAVGALRPDLLDVRDVIVRCSVFAVAALLAIAVFAGLADAYRAINGSPPSTGLSAVFALIVAAGFQPALVVLHGVVDRLIFGDRARPIVAASQVGEALGSDPVFALRALRQSLVLPYAAILRDGAVVVASGTATTATFDVPLAIDDRPVGTLVVGLRPGELRLSSDDAAVLRIVAPAMAQAVHASALSAELEQSRGRVVASIEDERRRIRRDLHDGLGPTLTGVAYAADAARNLMGDDPAAADDLLEQLRADTARAILEIRRLVEGLRPPALDELGLVEALRGQAARTLRHDAKALVVRVSADQELGDLPAAVEVAAFRIATEALTNVVRHSDSESAEVRLGIDGDALVVDVYDAGRSNGVWVAGVGLTSMRERAREVGGSCTAQQTPDGGWVHAVLPLAETV